MFALQDRQLLRDAQLFDMAYRMTDSQMLGNKYHQARHHDPASYRDSYNLSPIVGSGRQVSPYFLPLFGNRFCDTAIGLRTVACARF